MTAQITQNLCVAIIGLGYVGLPLAYEFSKHREVVCFDIDEKRILELRGGYDRTLEIEPECLQTMPSRNFTCEINELEHCNCYIATVPTPIDENNKPDLTNLIAVSEMIGGILKMVMSSSLNQLFTQAQQRRFVRQYLPKRPV